MSRAGLHRLVATVFLATFAAYQVAAFGEFRKWFKPRLSHQIGNIFWASNWKMFTYKSRYHVALVFEGRHQGGEWTELPMHEWYPARWESGYRWDRPAVRRYGQIQEQFLHLACQKSGMDQTRMLAHRWKKRLRSMKQHKRNHKTALIKTWICSRTPRTPSGQVL